MSIEEMLRPRYKVMSDYPTSRMYFEVGDVLTTDYSQGIERVIGGKDASMSPLTVKSYPHIFKLLQWWEDRKLEDMPEYIKYWDTSLYFPIDRVCKSEDTPFSDTWTSSNFLPATKEDYETYLTTNKLNP